MEKLKKEYNETQDYINKTACHLFTYAEDKRGSQTFKKILLFTKDGEEMYAELNMNEKFAHIHIRSMNDIGKFWTKYKTFDAWRKYKSIRHFKDMNIKLEKVQKILDSGWTDKTILESAVKEIFID